MYYNPEDKFEKLPGYTIDRTKQLGEGAFGSVFVGTKNGSKE